MLITFSAIPLWMLFREASRQHRMTVATLLHPTYSLECFTLLHGTSLQNSLYLPLIGILFLVVSYVKPRRYNLADLLLLTSTGVSAVLFFFVGEALYYVVPLLSLHGNRLLLSMLILTT